MRSGTPAADGLTMPPEWAAHERCVLAWPCRSSMWGDLLAAVKRDQAAVINAIARFEPVLVVARPGDGPQAGAACPEAEVVEWAIDDSWTRDIGAIVLTGNGRRAGLDPDFNGWGEKYTPYGDDACFAERMCGHLGLDRYDASPFVLEGGAISVDGAGTVITTEECLLNPNRNPTLDRHEIEGELRTWLGVERVVWLPYGLVEDTDTDGHVDNVAMSIGPDLVLAQTTADEHDANHARLQANVDTLVAAGYEVIEVDLLPSAVVGGERVVVPPTNLYLANGAAIVPVVAGPTGEEALDLLGVALPDREIVGVPGELLAFGGGGVHCITQQVPTL